MCGKASSFSENAANQLFINKYSVLFDRQLSELDDTTKHIIKNNKQLNAMYDLFLDFIIDSNRQMDYNSIKEQIKNN